MKKSFTNLALLLFLCLNYSLFAQASKAEKQTKIEVKSKRSTTSSGLFFTKANLIEFGFSEDQMAKDFQITPEGLYQPLMADDKLKDIARLIQSKNEQSGPADVLLSSLPKIKKIENFDQMVSDYHGLLEEIFAANPGMLEILGAAFSRAYNDPEQFREIVKMASDKGHTVN